MPIQITCASCSAKVNVKDELIGKAIKCPKCGERIAVPANGGDNNATTAHDPHAALPSPRCTVTHSPSPADTGTAAYIPGQDTEPRSTERERSPAMVSVPGYEIDRVLGRGGMGVVYKALHLKLKRTVALKMVLAGGHAGPGELARFRIEAEAVARLQHPNIVQIHEVGEADGHPYCALEFVEGGNLANMLGGKPMPAAEAANLVETLARAMQLAHSRNVIHRDLKPANILLTADGTPKITDFGLARQMDSDSGETRAGAVMGTPSYMAPEQASGHAHEAGPAADIYALGAILYDCLAGRPPFKGKTVVDTLDQVRTQEPTAPSRWQASIPLDLETICLKCLRKEPENRYASAAELADELVRYQQGEPILARPVGRLERAGKWVKRNKLLTGAAATVLLVLIAGFVVSSSLAVVAYLQAKAANDYAKKADDNAKKADDNAKKADEQKTAAQKKEQEARAEAAKVKKALEFVVGIFELSDANGQRGTVTARQILEDAEKTIPVKFAGQPELQKELLADVEKVFAKLTANSPLAMIFEVSGAVQLHSSRNANQRAVPQTLLYAGDRLSLAADSHVRLVILSDWHIERLRPGTEATIRRKGCEPANAVQDRDPSVLMTFVPLPKGTFYMGGGGGRSGMPTQIKEDFEIAVHVVTQGQWQAVMGENPSNFSRLSTGRVAVKDISDEELKLFPVEMVSWNDAQEFITRLNEIEHGKGYLYRLPTEVEWEYACRGGATSEEESSYHFYFARPTNMQSTEHANFNGNTIRFAQEPNEKYLGRTTRVGAYPPNKLGLYDMHGNVWQWCVSPASSGPGRMMRGGGWFNLGLHAQAGYREGASQQGTRANDHGLRLIRVAVGKNIVKVVPEEKKAPPLDMKFVKIPAGVFWMSQDDKNAQREVNIKEDFYLGQYPVTQAEWQNVMGNNPSGFSRVGPDQDRVKDIKDDELKQFPVERVSWSDVQVFLKKLNEREKYHGWKYRLPTEAEWEYACRGAATSKEDCGFDFYLDRPANDLDSSQANFDGAPGPFLQRPCKVGSYKPNKLGLFDMHGNVAQWCEDLVDPTGPVDAPRVVRGGGWGFQSRGCRASGVLGIPPGRRLHDVGFRLVRVPIAKETVKVAPGEKKLPPPIAGKLPPSFQNSIGMKFVWIPPGTFLMGSPKEEKEREQLWDGTRGPDETQHKVTLTKGFYMAVYTVTQEQWQEVMGNNPSHFRGEVNLPVERISWDDCQEFVKKLRAKDKKRYRLPTEAEWEYACRAGTSTPFNFGETIFTDQANYYGDRISGISKKGVFRKKTVPVGSFPANAFGLHDMHGNVWQWCQDWLGDYPQKDVVDPQGPEKGQVRVLRGGSWDGYPQNCRSAYRLGLGPSDDAGQFGLRVCFSMDDDGIPPPKKDSPKQTEAPTPPKDFTNSIGMQFVIVPKGTGWLGGDNSQPGQTKVVIEQDFYLGKYEVTQEEWEKVTKKKPSAFSRTGQDKDAVKDLPDADLGRFPVDSVSWWDCQEFVKRLNDMENPKGWKYRLPTEAEWEYACRGGPSADKAESGFDFYFKQPTKALETAVANYQHQDSPKRTCKVGTFQPNRLGLHDMHGNVWEWCADDRKDSQPAIRGGCWYSPSGQCRATERDHPALTFRGNGVGLRLALVAVP